MMQVTTNRVLTYACAVLLAGIAVLLPMCSGQPVAINYGVDKCAWCQQEIDDNHFGSTLVTQDGKVFKFNSIECLMAFHIQPTVPNETFEASWVCDYNNPGHLIRAGQAAFVHTTEKSSPNGVGLFAFSSDDEALKFADETAGKTLEWDAVKKLVRSEWFEHVVDTTTVADSLAVDTAGQ
jgi:copper chaperone NosL